jgi:hypothetical protein
MKRAFACAAAGAILLLGACNPSSTDPRGVVVNFLKAVRASDTLTILRSVTLQAPYTLLLDTGLVQGSARSDTIMMARLISELTLGGNLYDRWVDKQMVVGDAEWHGDDSAEVEVSFLSRRTGIQYYNKFGLVRHDRYWQIYSFKTRKGPSP